MNINPATDTINVLGLGPSLQQFTPNGCLTIGVNDISKHHSCNRVVCVDPPRVFSSDRVEYMKNGPYEKFITNLPEDWAGLAHSIEPLTFGAIRGDITRLDEPGITCYSNNSPFVAAVLAYRAGAKYIVMYGVDFTTHPRLGAGSSHDRAIADFVKLYKALRSRRVSLTVVSEESALHAVGGIPVYRNASKGGWVFP